jgi:hypothetical protein
MMIDCRADRRFALAFVALLVATPLLAPPVLAQDDPREAPRVESTPVEQLPGGTVPLPDFLPDPSSDAAPDTAPLDVETMPPPGAATETPTDLLDDPGPAGVSVDRLDAVTSESVGILTPDNGGYSPDIWRKSHGPTVLDLLARIPAGHSPAIHDLARRLLLTSAAAPRDLDPSRSFLAARIAALLRLGAFDDAIELIALVPRGVLTDDVMQGSTEALFWAGDDARACDMARAQVRISLAAFWRRALVYCQARDGQVDAASLSLSLLFETADEADIGFLNVAAHLVGQLDDAEPALTDGLAFATTMAAGIAIDVTSVADASPAASRALALHPEVAEDVRLLAAESAAAAGALSAGELAAAYSRPAFSDSDLVDPLPIAGDAPDARGRALLFQASRQQQAPDVRAAIFAALFAPSESGGPGFGPAARATGVSLLTVAPGETVIWFASDALPALIASERYETAHAWYLALAEQADYDPEALAAQRAALPLLAAARIGAGRDWRPALAAQWWQGLPETYDEAARADAATPVFMVLDALGLAMGPEAWALYQSAPETISAEIPNVGIRFAMRDAARARRTGEAALWALVALGESGPAAADPVTLGSVIRILRATGFTEDARAVALESLIERGR